MLSLSITQKGAKKSKVIVFALKFLQSSEITTKQCEIGCKLLLITNRKSHMCFRLVPKSVNLE